MAGNVKRAIGIAVQSAQGTPATTPTWLRYIEKRDVTPNLAYDTPKYERYVRWMAGDSIPTTKHTGLSMDGRVDSREFPRLLTAFANYVASGGDVHTFDFALSGLKFLTIWLADGLTGEMWQAVDCRGDKLSLDLDYTAGTYKFSAQLLGLALTRLTSGLPAISYPAYTHRDPFAPWQTPVRLAGTAFCAIMSKLAIDNHLSMLYCSPTADPDTSTLPGLAPTEIQEGEASATWDLTARYLGYTSAPTGYKDYLENVERAYTIVSTRPEETIPHTMTWTLPRWKGTKGHLDTDPAKVNLRQEVSGELLLDDTTATGLRCVILNDIADMTA